MPPSSQGHKCVRAIIKLMILEFRLGRAWPNRRRPHSLCPSACHVARLANCHETLACHAVVLSSAAFERQSPRCTEQVFDLSFNTCTHCGIQTLSDAFRGCVPFGVEVESYLEILDTVIELLLLRHVLRHPNARFRLRTS